MCPYLLHMAERKQRLKGGSLFQDGRALQVATFNEEISQQQMIIHENFLETRLIEKLSSNQSLIVKEDSMTLFDN